MFEEFVPKLKIGTIKPLSVIDLSCYEFYRLAPPGVLLIMIGAGLGKFSKDDVERVFAPIDSYMDQLVERGADLVMQSGVPLPLLLGVEDHDRLIDRMAKRSGKPATSSVLGVVAAAKRLGLRRIAVANKWSEPMNRRSATLRAAGPDHVAPPPGSGAGPVRRSRTTTACSSPMSWARCAHLSNADGLYIGGGSRLSEPVCQALEREFGKPAISNASAMVWDTLTRLGAWAPIPGGAPLGLVANAPDVASCTSVVAHGPGFPQRSPPSLLTTACGGLRSAPDCRTRRPSFISYIAHRRLDGRRSPLQTHSGHAKWSNPNVTDTGPYPHSAMLGRAAGAPPRRPVVRLPSKRVHPAFSAPVSTWPPAAPLLDDIATVLDDVAMTKIATKKTIGVLGDDLALNAHRVAGVDPRREPGGVAKGSCSTRRSGAGRAAAERLRALAAIPLMIIGGAFLCFEVEKLA